MPFVERFAWKTRPAGDIPMRTSTLFHSDGPAHKHRPALRLPLERRPIMADHLAPSTQERNPRSAVLRTVLAVVVAAFPLVNGVLLAVIDALRPYEVPRPARLGFHRPQRLSCSRRRPWPPSSPGSLPSQASTTASGNTASSAGSPPKTASNSNGKAPALTGIGERGGFSVFRRLGPLALVRSRARRRHSQHATGRPEGDPRSGYRWLLFLLEALVSVLMRPCWNHTVAPRATGE